MAINNQPWPRSPLSAAGAGYVTPPRRQVPSRAYGGPLRFVETLRGKGVLAWSGGETPVAYELDLFDGRMGRTGSGTLDGELPDLDGPVELRLSDTTDVAVALIENDSGEAVIETRGAIRERAAPRRRAKP